jgi:hypothetical protein
MCPDVTGGITMFAEEASDADLDTATPPAIAGTADPVRPGTQKRSRRTQTPDSPETTTQGHTAPTLAAVPTPPPDDDLLDTPTPPEEAPTEAPTTTDPPTLEATEDAPAPPQPTRQQTAKAMTLFGQLGLTTRVDRLTATSAYLGKTVHSWNDLTPDEASVVIDHLIDVMSEPTPT